MRLEDYKEIGILLIILVVLWLFRATKNKTETFGSSDHASWYMWGAMPWNGWNYGTAKEYDL